MNETTLIDDLKARFPEAVLDTPAATDMPVLVCRKSDILALLKVLRDDFQYQMLTDLTAVDYLTYPVKKTQRFEVVYMLYNLEKDARVRLKVPVGMTDLSVPSATPLFKVANWLEREAWDMFGIQFAGHPCLKRILNHIEFVGHPLRKDYPVDKRQVLTTNDSLLDEMEIRLKEKGLK